MSSVAEILRFIKRLEEIHTKVQGRISSPHLATTLIYDVSRRWSHYLNRYVAMLPSNVVEALGVSAPFSLKPIMVELEVGCYIGPILPTLLAEIVAGRQSSGSSAPKSAGGGSNGRSNGGWRRK